MTSILPWEGPQYKEGLNGKKVMVLGESNYAPKGISSSTDYTNIVKDNVCKLVFKERNAFFTKTARLLLIACGHASTDRQDIESLWNRIAFHNYVQAIFEGSRVRPTEDQWSQGWPVLSSCLELLKPNVLIVLGKELGERLRPLPTELLVVKVNHPSSGGFSYKPWIPQIAKAMKTRSLDA